MHLNRSLLFIIKGYPKLHRSLVLYELCKTNSFSSISKRTDIYYPALSQLVHLKLSKAWSGQNLCCMYSSAVNEKQVVKNQPSPVISVPSLQFEDVEFEQPVSHGDLCNALQECNSIDEQMITLTYALSLSPDDVKRRFEFCKVIESLLKPFFGNIKIQIFGSTVNGFGFKGCDLDMSFETFVEQETQVSYLETPDVPLVSEVMCGKVLPNEISLLPRREQLLFIHTVLLEFYKESVDPSIFINAHVPLVRFYHDKYNLKCDLSCRNRVAYANTKLLHLFGKLDERVIPMMMTIRYWAKHVELIGKGLMFNTYTISLLVIHFFQTRNPPILPSAEYILSISGSLELDDADNKTLNIIKSIPPSKNMQTLSELLKDFFFFYLYFDFTRVICPLIGGSIPREKFFSNLPNRKFRMNTICVQDPMLESHNVAELVDYKNCKKLISEIMAVCRIFQSNISFTPLSLKWGLLTLLDKPEAFLPQNRNLEKNVCFTIPLFTAPIIGEDNSKDKYFATAESLLHLLQYILLFECSTLQFSDVMKRLKKHDEMIEKQAKILESVNERALELVELYKKFRKKSKGRPNLEKYNVPANLMQEDFEKFSCEYELILCAECKVLKNSWLGRDFAVVESFPLDSAQNLIEKEHQISLQVAKQNELNSIDGKFKPFMFFYECYLSSKTSESSLLVNFRPFQRTNFNPILGIFLKEYIPKLVKNLNETF